MSADSPRRGVHKGAQVVSPQPIVDRSIIDSVAGIINDIVPQAYAGTPNSDNKESISWARFEYADINDPALYPDYNEGSNTPPLLLVLGYTTGVQVWLVAATGEATEVLSWRQGVVRTLRILPNPKTDKEHVDLFDLKRPMVAVCDSAGPGPQFCNISFISLKTGEQAKSIKFKNPVCDILANKRSIVVTFLEKIAMFDARTMEDVLTVTTCYASPGPNPNPIALGTRWLAYSEKKLLPVKRSSGGCEVEGVQSYTATVLYAAKSLGKGLRDLGETVASSLTGNSVSPVVVNNTSNDVTQPGVITILDLQAAKEEKELDDANIETVIAHFTAHSDAIVAMTFDLSGALLMTADKRGHDFHVFRIQPHPGGPALAAVHHLYILHRGDTTAKVQDMVFSSDTRWAAVSTLRGTTHVFPVAPYGGPVGVRTHSTPHVVNRLSRFHRSAGLMDDGTRSHSPVSHTELPLSIYPYSNPRLPPYPHPTVLHPLAQIRQPSSLNLVNSQAQQRPQQRQRLHSDDSGILPLKICACFAPPRAWMYAQRESTAKVMKRAVDSLFIMACHGNMIQYDLEPKPTAGIPKEKVCDDTMIELEVEAKGQWPLLRCPNSEEILPPLPTSSPLPSVVSIPKDIQDVDLAEDRWLSQVEIVTHAGPHRRLWMGPQFVFKTYNATSGAPVNLVEAEAIEIGVTGASRPARSNPVNMPRPASRALVPVVIDGSGSSYEQSPRFMEAYGDSLDSENAGVGNGENQLREDLAEAMLETSIAPHRAAGRRSVFERVGQPVTKVVNPLGTVITVFADEEDNSNQEFVFAEECHVPEPPRSVCAEEGPASLGDFEPESQTLRDFTEICAEIRSASEPVIDSVPDENIREVKERKSLCVEIAAIADPGSSSIDFEKEEAFRDMPTNMSLCVEQGEIPSSPMTQAKETVWCKRFEKREDRAAHERIVPEAQYVVNCSDDNVVLMENRSVHWQRNAPTHWKTDAKRASCDSEKERTVKKSGRNAFGTSSGKRTETKTPIKKYVLKEHEDSIVIEDTTREDTKKSNCEKRKGCERAVSESGRCKSNEGKIECSRETTKSKGRSKCTATQQEYKEAKSTVKEETERTVKLVESIVEQEYTIVDPDTTEEFKSLDTVVMEPDNSPPVESMYDFNSSEYHIVESACCVKDTTLVQSDEDIEHIQSSEISQLEQTECIDDEKRLLSSPIGQRKNSKNTISDDDLEHITTSELVEMPERKSNEDPRTQTEAEMRDDRDSSVSKRALSDDDLEHVQHSDVCPMMMHETVRNDREGSVKKSQEILQEQSTRSKPTRRTKDIVVIESDTSTADVTVIIKPIENWPNKSLERKEEHEESTGAKDNIVGENPSPSRKTRTRSSKSSCSAIASKWPPGASESSIATMCKTGQSETTEETLATVSLTGSRIRVKKSRKNKKSSIESNAQTELTESSKNVDEIAKESSSEEPVSEVSWSTIVKKKSVSVERELTKGDEKKLDEIETTGTTELSKRNDSTIEDSSKKSHDSKRCTENARAVQVKLRDAVTAEPDSSSSEEPIVQTAGVSWSWIVKKKNSVEHEEKDLEVEGTSIEDESNAPVVEQVESLFRSSTMIDKLHEAVTELDSGESVPRTTKVSWSSIVKERNVTEHDEAELDFVLLPIADGEVSSDERKTRGKQTKSALLSETIDEAEETVTETTTVNETIVDETTPRETEGSSWSSIVEKRASSTVTESPKESLRIEETKKPNPFEKVDPTIEDRETKPVCDATTENLLDDTMDDCSITCSTSGPNRSEKHAKLDATLGIASDADDGCPETEKSIKFEPFAVLDLTFFQEETTEPEKRSDSEHEVVPERSSSSDELNANVVFAATDGDYTDRETVERTAATTSVCATSKKGNRSKKKKHR
ncbi:uncharacterized protein LOC143151636 isoform X2 [Ptiloglossa arizonensis]|uniref:uncharacterized protein LOC143151636 isoform X2 n=1 Tax=Ptiloglossa arizonensis TaxID=3350558 RepID=UPI003F9F5A80